MPLYRPFLRVDLTVLVHRLYATTALLHDALQDPVRSGGSGAWHARRTEPRIPIVSPPGDVGN